MKDTRRRELGSSGEAKAISFLKDQGYKILEQNYRNKLGEIDIIAKDGNTVCFVEVKTRTGKSLGYPQEALTRAKKRKISQVVLGYLKSHNLPEKDFRFDVVAVILGADSQVNEINLIKDAFPLDSGYFFR